MRLNHSYWAHCYNCDQGILNEQDSVKLEVRLRRHPDVSKFNREICSVCFSLLYHALPQAFDKHSWRLSVRRPGFGGIAHNLYSLKKKLPYDSIEELNLSTRSHNCLAAVGIKTIGQLLEVSDKELLKIKNLGLKALNEIKYALTFYGLK